MTLKKAVIKIKKMPIAKEVSDVWIRKVICKTIEMEKSQKRFVSVLLTNNTEIRQINKKFLKHDYATDVISFEAGTGYLAGKEADYLGDVVVSVDMAQSMAKDLEIPWRDELARYLVHGTLHLLGYDDQSSPDRAKMSARQEKILEKIIS